MLSFLIFKYPLLFCKEYSFFLIFTVVKVTENDYQIGMCFVLLVFRHFPIWRFGSVVKLDCINL